MFKICQFTQRSQSLKTFKFPTKITDEKLFVLIVLNSDVNRAFSNICIFFESICSCWNFQENFEKKLEKKVEQMNLVIEKKKSPLGFVLRNESQTIAIEMVKLSQNNSFKTVDRKSKLMDINVVECLFKFGSNYALTRCYHCVPFCSFSFSIFISSVFLRSRH